MGQMKKSILLIPFAAAFAVGLYFIINRNKDDSMKNVGHVVMICEGTEQEIKGYKIERVFEEDKNTFAVPEKNEVFNDIVTVKKTETTENAPTEQEIKFKEELTDDMIALCYRGDFIEDEKNVGKYRMYDDNFLYTGSSDNLEVVYKEGKSSYVSVDVKWGYPKNYTIMRYYFKVEA